MAREDVIGTWDLRIRTPIGSIRVALVLQEGDAGLVGEAVGDESVPLRDVRTAAVPDGDRITWSQSITRPMRLDLEFDVVVSGDDLRGSSRAGRLPRSAVTGRRRR